MARMNWNRSANDLRKMKSQNEYAEVRHSVSRILMEQKIAKASAKRDDVRRAIILQAAVKAGIFRGPIPIGPTLRSTDTPKDIRKEQYKRSFFKHISQIKTSDKHFKKEQRQWNAASGNPENTASQNPC